MSKALWLSRSAMKRTSPSNSTCCVAMGWLTIAPFESVCVSIATRMSLIRSATFVVPSSCSLMGAPPGGRESVPGDVPDRSGARRLCRGFRCVLSQRRLRVLVRTAVGDVPGPRVRHEQAGGDADDGGDEYGQEDRDRTRVDGLRGGVAPAGDDDGVGDGAEDRDPDGTAD